MSRCQDKTDLKIVTICPTSKEEWDSAARKKNCSQFVALDTNEERNEYHCVINAFLNATLEVCAPVKTMFGYCTEYNVAGQVLQNHEEAQCNEESPRCDKVYSSADAYKFQDCYKIVYDKRNKDDTTQLPPEKTTSVKSKDEDNGSWWIIATIITVAVAISVSVFLVFTKKRKEKKRNKCDEEEDKPLTNTEAVNSNNEAVNSKNEGEESIKYFHFEAKNFEHFEYVYNLTRKYTQNDEIQLEDIIIKIGVVGKFTDDNLNLFPKGYLSTGKTNLAGKLQNVWEAVPVLCFQNDLSVQSALETLRQSGAFYHILVTSEPVCKTDIGDDPVTIIGQTKKNIMINITSCLEQPLRHKLEQLLEDLPNKDSSTDRFLLKRRSEIKAFLKEMTFDDNEETVKENLPDDIQEYLFRSDGFVRAELSPSSLDVLVHKTTDDKQMKDDLTTLNPNFLDKFPLTIQKGTLIKEITGGFVSRTENDRKINNSTCGHDAPQENKVVYTKCRNFPQNMSDTEQKNERPRPKDVRDSPKQKKTEK